MKVIMNDYEFTRHVYNRQGLCDTEYIGKIYEIYAGPDEWNNFCSNDCPINKKLNSMKGKEHRCLPDDAKKAAECIILEVKLKML